MSYFISTSIPYVNSTPHIGFLWELLLADALARYQRQQGQAVFFLTGTDENGLNIAKVAAEKNISTQALTDQNAQSFYKLTQDFNISQDDFIRTTEARHRQAVYAFWRRCASDIFKSTYRGLYCLSCEAYYDEAEQPEKLCPIHQKPLEELNEENYFFRLTKYLTQVESLIESGQLRVYPESKRQEALSLIRSGQIGDLSISRSIERSRGWGIPVEGDASQVIYVWFDALINYLSGLGFGSADQSKFEQFWGEATAEPELVPEKNRVEKKGEIWHFVGKDIWKFHLIYWPAMLLAAGLKTPDVIHVHEFILNQGQKISKTIGNVVTPEELLAKYDREVIRYAFLKQTPFQDFDFTWAHLEQVATGELKHEIGNFVSRVFGLLKKAPARIDLCPNTFSEIISETKLVIQGGLSRADYSVGLRALYDLIKRGNQLIDEKKLWQGGDQPDWAALISILRMLEVYAGPVLPVSSEKIKTVLRLGPENVVYDNQPIVFPPLF